MSPQHKFVVCINNKGYPASLERRKLYLVVPDLQAEAHGMIRVIDESGEDYLFPADLFASVELPEVALDALAVVA
jgi:hypothetical protein